MSGVTDQQGANRDSPKERHQQRANTMATCCGADPEGYAHSYTHYVEPRPTTQRGSGYIHRYLEAVHTEMNQYHSLYLVCVRRV